MKPYFGFSRIPQRNTCHHGQRTVTKWWHLDWLVCNMKYECPLIVTNSVKTSRGIRVWLYTWWGSMHVDLLLMGTRPLTRAEKRRLKRMP